VEAIKPQPGDILVRYSRIPATNEYDEIGRYLVLDKIGSTGRNATPFAPRQCRYRCILLSFDREYYASTNRVGSMRQVGEWMFSQVGDKWKILVESGLSWEGE